LPPSLFDVVFELHTKGTVVPGVCQAAVDLAARVDEASVFAKADDFFHGFFAVVHKEPPAVLSILIYDLTKEENSQDFFGDWVGKGPEAGDRRPGTNGRKRADEIFRLPVICASSIGRNARTVSFVRVSADEIAFFDKKKG
jgi:hypothetical protein